MQDPPLPPVVCTNLCTGEAASTALHTHTMLMNRLQHRQVTKKAINMFIEKDRIILPFIGILYKIEHIQYHKTKSNHVIIKDEKIK